MPALEEGEVARAPRPRSQAALHAAAAALHGGVAGQGAGRARHRPAVHLRVDPRHHHQRPRLRPPRAPHAVPDRARHRGHRPLDAVLPGHHERRVHRADGRRARQRRRGRARLGEGRQGLLRPVREGPEEGQEGDGQPEGGRRDRRGVPRVRQAAARAPRPLRQVLRVLGVSRLQVHAGPGKNQRAEDEPTNETCPTLRQADGHQARAVRQVHRVLGLPGVQDDQARHARHRVPGARLQRPARRAPLASAAAPSTAAPPIRTASSSSGSAPWPSRARSARRTFLTERIARGGRPVRMCVREGCGFRQEVEPTVA